MNIETFKYDNRIVRAFAIATVVWGVVGMLVGLLAAVELFFPGANLNFQFITFGRIRPLHTNAVIFAFVGNGMFMGIYYSLQRLCKARMFSDWLSWFNFWGWQIIIVSAALTLPLGYTTSKEYAELEWPIDIAIAVVWVAFAVNLFGTIVKRREKHMYVAIWFYIATIVTVAVLHIVNSLELPLNLFKSYSVYSGVQDAMVQWWYGHNAVAFFLTTPILGIMYYFMPKAAERPVYSYRLSIVHFWALVFIYIWAGPHHLLFTALPDWAQSLGMIFSLMLWAPSWGGMLNGLLTLRGVWNKVREEPVLKFFVASVTFYGMSTFEGPLMSIKSVSSLSHYTDWVIGHVHGGALGWNGLMAAGMFYWMAPRLWDRPLHSKKAADAHFWIATIGIILYMVSMWVSGVNQGLMWRALNPDGSLTYPSFTETLIAIRPMYIVRVLGGVMYLVGFLLMVWNLAKTLSGAKAVNGSTEVVVEQKAPSADEGSVIAVVTGRPLWFTVIALALTLIFYTMDNPLVAAGLSVGVLIVSEAGYVLNKRERAKGAPSWFGIIEHRPFGFTVFVLISILVGGVVEIVPLIVAKQAVPPTKALEVATNAMAQKPYAPLEQQGRDLYIREGCYYCHSQMIRPMLHEYLRYGDASRAEEFIYDHPFQWGSKRTGPDLHRIGGKYPSLWHFQHLMDPRSTSQGSNMPGFPWLATWTYDDSLAPKKLALLRTLGVPYTDQDIADAEVNQRKQADFIVADLDKSGVKVQWNNEVVALIAYLQRLGRDHGVPLADGPVKTSALEAPAIGGGR